MSKVCSREPTEVPKMGSVRLQITPSCGLGLGFNVYGCFVFMYICAPYVHLVLREARRGSDPLELSYRGL